MTRQWRRSGKRPKLVIDTNLFVSGLLSPEGSAARLLVRLPKRRFIVCGSQAIFDEYRDVLHRFTRISQGTRHALLGKIRHHLLWVRPTRSIDPSPLDPTDTKFLECAVEAQADFLLTRDKALLELGSFEGIPIVSLATFNAIMGWR